jgi:glutathione peroxidase
MRVYEYAFQSIDGASMPLERWNSQPLLLVNTASECGYTPQYAKLEAVWREYRPAGLVVIGIPCDEFGGQEPGSEEEIRAFCTENYGVTFPLTTKQQVIGRHAHPLFVALREQYTSDILPRWNFTKYLFGRDGELVRHWPSATEPDDPGFRHDLEANLGSWNL